MPSPGTLTALAFYLAATVISGLWLRRVQRPALRPALTTTILIAALASYTAVAITLAVSRP
jgi:hypothetical protein